MGTQRPESLPIFLILVMDMFFFVTLVLRQLDTGDVSQLVGGIATREADVAYTCDCLLLRPPVAFPFACPTASCGVHALPNMSCLLPVMSMGRLNILVNPLRCPCVT